MRGGGLSSKRALSCHSPACKRYDPYDFRSASFWEIRKMVLCSSRKHISSKFRWRSSGKLLKNKSARKQQQNRIKELCTERYKIFLGRETNQWRRRAPFLRWWLSSHHEPRHRH